MTAATTLSADDLKQFTGSGSFYRHGLARGVLYTEGAQYVAEHAGAYWLLDELAFNQRRRAVRAERFQVWTLKRKPDGNAASLTCGDGNGNVVFRKWIEFTDFPMPEIDLWAIANEFGGRPLMLPSEY